MKEILVGERDSEGRDVDTEEGQVGNLRDEAGVEEDGNAACACAEVEDSKGSIGGDGDVAG